MLCTVALAISCNRSYRDDHFIKETYTRTRRKEGTINTHVFRQFCTLKRYFHHPIASNQSNKNKRKLR